MLNIYDNLQDAAMATQDPGLPVLMEEKYNAGLKRLGAKVWRGTLQVAASGFGKGVIATMVLVLVAGMLGGGYAAIGANNTGQALMATFDDGLVKGFNYALGFLTSGLGLLTTTVGGAIGAVIETRGNQNKINAAMAEMQAAEYARERERQQALAIAPSVKAAMPDTESFDKDCNYCAKEMQRRAQAAQQRNTATGR